MNIIIDEVMIMLLFVVLVATVLSIVDYCLHYIRKKYIANMNRHVVSYGDSGWIVLIDVKHRFVGLYFNSHAVSHATIRLGKDVLSMTREGVSELTIGDFRKIDVDIPRFSYRVLYEYKVPHETRVILY